MFDSIFPKHWTTLQRLMWLKTNALARAVYEIVTGNPVTFSAKAAPLKQLKVAFSPVQSLNGYDSPWPAGGGKNKLPEEWEIGGISTQNGADVSQQNTIRFKDYTPVTAGESYYLCIPSGTSAYIFWYSSAAYTSYVGNSGGYVTAGVITIPSGVSYMRLQMNQSYGTTYKNDIAINYPSSVTTYSPYSNLCPISGWSSVTVEQRGKNLADLTDLEFDDTLYSHSLNITNYPKLRAFVDDIASLAGQTVFYTVETTGTSQGGQQPIGAFRFVVGGTNVQSFHPNEAHTITPFDPTAVTAIFIYGNGNGASVKNLMVSLGSTAPAEYTPYNPSSRSISISLGSTVYGGYVDVISGVGEVTHGAKSLAGLDWAYNGTRFEATATSLGIKPPSANNVAVNAISSAYKAYRFDQVGSNNNTFGVSALGGGQYFVRIHDDRFTTKEALAEALTNVTFVFELATPIPISIYPTEINALAGENVVWSDADTVTVEYRPN